MTATPHLKPVIHIGQSKTGTSTLQHHLFSRHDGIEFLGHSGYPGGPPIQFRNSDVARLAHDTGGRSHQHPDFDACDRIFAEHIQPALDAGRVPVLSMEALAAPERGDVALRAANLHRVFGDSYIVLVLRNPVHRFVSNYYQHLKKVNVTVRASKHRADWFVPFDDWYRSRIGAGTRSPGDVSRVLDVYAEQFGHDNFGIFLFEELVSAPENYYRKLCRFMRVDEDEGWEISRGQRENGGWSQLQISRLRRICNSGWRSQLYSRMSARYRIQWLGLQKPDDSPRFRVELKDDVARRISEYFEDEYRQIETDWSLPLSQYGYFSEPLQRAA